MRQGVRTIAFVANLRTSLMARGARFLNCMPYICNAKISLAVFPNYENEPDTLRACVFLARSGLIVLPRRRAIILP